MRKLNTKPIMSAARHPQIDGYIERVDETMQICLRCYSFRSLFWLGIFFTRGWFLLQICFNQWSFDAFLFVVSYAYLRAALIDRLWPVIDAPALDPNHLFDLISVWNVVRELQTMYGFSFFSTSPIFFLKYLVFLYSKVYIFTCVIKVSIHFTLLKLA
jgi:hypothetical protein